MKAKKQKINRDYVMRQLPLHLMLFFPCVIVLIYHYFPLVGVLMAFQNYTPTLKGFLPSLFSSKFVGLDIFRYIFLLPGTKQVFFNTVYISLMKIIADLVFPVLFALMLNEVARGWFKKTVQTITFIPFFLSWVILAGILLDVFSPREGIVNQILVSFGLEPVYFFGSPAIFPYALVATNIWKEIGYNTIIVLAAITGIDPTLYEAAIIDGAKRIKRTLYVTVPSITPIVLLLAILSLANVLNAGFDQVFNLYSPSVYATGDILDTYVYRLGLLQGQYSLATAVGLLKSAVSFVLIAASYRIANKYSDYRIF